MRVKIAVGSVELRLDGVDLTKRQISALMREAASIALAVGQDDEESDDPRHPIGFSASMELDPERNIEPDLSEWFEESP